MLETYDLPRLAFGSGLCFIQVPETHPAHEELAELGVEADCIQVGTGSHGPKVYLYRWEEWARAVLKQRNGHAPRAIALAGPAAPRLDPLLG